MVSRTLDSGPVCALAILCYSLCDASLNIKEYGPAPSFSDASNINILVIVFIILVHRLFGNYIFQLLF